MEEKKKKKSYRSLRKWSRLLLAIVASVLLLNKPVFNFVDEKGLENTRTCVMTPTRFELHYIEMATGIDRPMYAMSVKGLYYGAWAILLGCVFCAFFYEIHELRILSCLITGAYYLIMIYYAIELSQKFCIILYPNLIAMLPVAVLLIMLSIRNTTVRKLMNAMQAADEAPAHEK